MRLCESLYSKEKVISAIEAIIGGEIKTDTYLNSAEQMHCVREAVNQMIKSKI